LEVFLSKLNGGRQVIINAAQIIDNNGNLSGAIQTIEEVGTSVPNKESIENSSSVLPDESFGDPVFRTDLQGMICYWDQACEKQYCYSSSQMVGQSPEPLISEEHRTNFKKTITDVLNGANFTNKEWKYHTHNGKDIYVLAKAYPLPSSDKKNRECVIVSTDITALKVKQRKVERFAAESKEKMKKLTEEYDLVKKNIASFIRKKGK
jgi:PAS domain S-box-containing protein